MVVAICWGPIAGYTDCFVAAGTETVVAVGVETDFVAVRAAEHPNLTDPTIRLSSKQACEPQPARIHSTLNRVSRLSNLLCFNLKYNRVANLAKI